MADMHDAPALNEIADDTAAGEKRFHTYRTHHIPMYVRLMWLGFYLLAAWYLIEFLFPSIREEFHVEPKARRHVVDVP